MKHQAMLINSIECFYLCGGSSIKCVNNEIDNCNTQNMDVTNFLSAEAIQPLHKYINYFLNQARAGRAPGFLKLILCGLSVCVFVCVCLCVRARGY